VSPGQLRRTAKAEEDLIEIWTYIAQDNPQAADRLLDRLDEKSYQLADNPHLGPKRPEIADGVRSWPVGNYLILYRELDGGAEIVRYVHGARRLQNLLNEI
jgi:toxin ParE1/3/4